jgi:hypothetical protein
LFIFSKLLKNTNPFNAILVKWGKCAVSLILTIILFMWIVAKIYRVGILMYGKKPSLPEIMRWIKAK